MSSRLTFASLIPKFKRLGHYIDIHGDYIEFFKFFLNYLVLSSLVRDKTGFNRIKPLSADFCSKVRLFANPVRNGHSSSYVDQNYHLERLIRHNN